MGLIKASNRKTRKPARSQVAQAKPKVHPAAPVPRPALRREPQAGPAVTMAQVRPVLVSPDARTTPARSTDSIEALLSRPPSASGAPPSAITSSIGSPPAPAGPFQIQVGAFQSAADAERHLASVRQRAGSLLGNKAALTSTFRRGDKVFYRARYAGFEAQAAASGVCAELKRLSINCLVMRAE
jgi:hypothetical protein